MILQKTNIEDELLRLKSKGFDSKNALQQVYDILNAHHDNQERIQGNIQKRKKDGVNNFVFDLLETDKIYHIDQIKKICIDYRLRFLSSKYFKGDIPQEAYARISALEKQHETELGSFKIIAPSKLFKLKDKDDPLLFAPIGNDYFYLIHKWGDDLHPLRKLLMWPFKNIINLTLVVFLMSYLTTLLVPDGLFSKTSSTAEFLIIFFFMFKCLASVVIFYGFALGKNFNPAIWNSKYFNA
ncbi:MAG: hypothetical protein ACFCUL_10830 [Flavobacteriaceae bacterium]